MSFDCPVCGARLIRAETLWVCPRGFHSKGIPDVVMRREGLSLKSELERSWRRMPFVERLEDLLKQAGCIW